MHLVIKLFLVCNLIFLVSCGNSDYKITEANGSLSCTNFSSCKEPQWKLLMAPGYNPIDYITLPNMENLGSIRTSFSDAPQSIAVDTKNNIIYSTHYVDRFNSRAAIYKTVIKETNELDPISVFVDTGIIHPTEIAFDWIGKNVYFIDKRPRTINICPATVSTRCAVIYKNTVEEPSGLVVHPTAGIMFWSARSSKANIKRANMDGTLVTAIITADILIPETVVLDKLSSRIYWTDMGKGTIETSDFDGGNRKVIIFAEDTKALALFGNTLYWYELSSNRFMRAEKLSGGNKTDITNQFVGEHFSRPFPQLLTTFQVMHESIQPELRNNTCKNLGCSQICALSGSNGATCLCPIGLIKNGTNCSEDSSESKILLAINDTLLTTPVNVIGKDMFDRIDLPVEISNISSMVYNPVNKTIILYEGNTKQIMEFDPKTKKVTILVDNITQVVSIDLDVVSENLFYLDSGRNEIHIMSLRTSSKRLFYGNVENANEIVVDMGQLYYSKYGEAGTQEIHKISINHNITDQLVKVINQNVTPVQMVVNSEHLVVFSMGSYMTDSENSSFSFMTGSILDMTMLDSLFIVDHMYNIKFVKADSLLDLFSMPNLRTIPTNIVKELNNSKIHIANIPNVEQLGRILGLKSDSFCFARNGSRCSQMCVACDNPDICATDGQCWCEDGFQLFNKFTCLEENKGLSINDRHFEMKETSEEIASCEEPQCTTYLFIFEYCTC